MPCHTILFYLTHLYINVVSADTAITDSISTILDLAQAPGIFDGDGNGPLDRPSTDRIKESLCGVQRGAAAVGKGSSPLRRGSVRAVAAAVRSILR